MAFHLTTARTNARKPSLPRLTLNRSAMPSFEGLNVVDLFKLRLCLRITNPYPCLPNQYLLSSHYRLVSND